MAMSPCGGESPVPPCDAAEDARLRHAVDRSSGEPSPCARLTSRILDDPAERTERLISESGSRQSPRPVGAASAAPYEQTAPAWPQRRRGGC
jgi:hypothetical protein